MKDECWQCGTEIDLDKDHYVQVTLFNGDLDLGPLHQACMPCAKKMHGAVHDDNIEALHEMAGEGIRSTIQLHVGDAPKDVKYAILEAMIWYRDMHWDNLHETGRDEDNYEEYEGYCKMLDGIVEVIQGQWSAPYQHEHSSLDELITD